ncbi:MULTISPECIES: hypothetical protein [Streptomyces]|uniref:hypothetical protein n=1 Tax=Streptomyces TaxID=1883 RepID=UPI0027DC1085|nr:hypothetical protein [Streptomyces sp. 9-7]
MPDFSVGICLQGGTEHPHGLACSLLFNIAVRSGDIVDSNRRRLDRNKLERAIAVDTVRLD